MAFNSEVACDWDIVNTVTVAVATGPVLYHLGRALRDEVRRLRLLVLHKEAAQWQTTDVAEVDRLCAEVATLNERNERLEFLLDRAAAKLKAELAGLYASLRRGPQAIAAAVDAEWDQLSDSASVFDVDYPSCLETETDAESTPENIDTGRTSRSFSVIDSSDEATVAADSSTEDERPEPAAAARRRSATPRPSSSPSSAMAQPHEFGPQPVPSSGTSTTAQHARPQRSTVQERLERPAATPSDAPAQSSPLSSVAPPAPLTASPVQPQPEPARPSSSSSSSSREGHASAPSSQPPVAAADAAKGLAEALFDMLEYNNQIFGYVAGLAVPVIPEDFAIFSADQLRAFRDVADHRRRQAVDAVNAANVRKQYLLNFRSSDGEALLAVVTEITLHEAARDRADRLRRVLSYAWYHRFEGISDERESQKRLIAFGRERLRAGGAPIYWCQSDADEARRFSTRTDAIWHPAAVPSPQPAPAPRRTSSRARSRSRVSFHPSSQTSASAAHRSGRAYRSPPPPPRSSSQSSQSRPSSPPARNPWAPRDESSLARQQYRDRINRLRLQRQGRWHGIPPCRTIHVSPFNKHQNKATLQRLMRRHGFDLDSDTAVVEYHVTSSQRSGKFHYYGFVTFADLDAAKLCVHELDRMDFDGHQGMTPIIKHDDGTVAHDILTFSFSKRNQNLDVDADAEDMDSRRRRRSSSRAPPARRQGRAATPARRQPSRAPVYDTDSDETGLEDY